MITNNHGLLKHAIMIVDHANRQLKLTPFQLALFYRDWHMWTMIRKYIDPSDAAAQLQTLEEQRTSYGTHYDFSDLKNAYQTYLDRYQALSAAQSTNWGELGELWFEVSKAPARAPRHVPQEFFRGDRSFDPTPKFDETKSPLCRAMKLPDTTRHLGVHFTFIRSHYLGEVHGFEEYTSEVLVAPDSLAVAELCQTRTLQYENLKAELLQAHAAPQSS